MQAQNNISRSFFGQCDQIGQNFAILVKKISPWTNIFGGLYFTIGPILGPIFIYLGQFFSQVYSILGKFWGKILFTLGKKNSYHLVTLLCAQVQFLARLCFSFLCRHESCLHSWCLYLTQPCWSFFVAGKKKS